MVKGKLAYKVLSCIVCDDIRQENNGKQILLGVYGSAIIVNTLPALLPLATRIEFECNTKGDLAFKVIIRSRTGSRAGSDIAESGGMLKLERTDESAALGTRVPVQIVDAGEYDVLFGLGPSKPKLVRKIMVRQPTDEERKRMSL